MIHSIIVVTTYFSILYITVQTVALCRTAHRKHTPVLNGSDATRGSCMAHLSVSNASSYQSRRVTDGVRSVSLLLNIIKYPLRHTRSIFRSSPPLARISPSAEKPTLLTGELAIPIQRRIPRSLGLAKSYYSLELRERASTIPVFQIPQADYSVCTANSDVPEEVNIELCWRKQANKATANVSCLPPPWININAEARRWVRHDSMV